VALLRLIQQLQVDILQVIPPAEWDHHLQQVALHNTVRLSMELPVCHKVTVLLRHSMPTEIMLSKWRELVGVRRN